LNRGQPRFERSQPIAVLLFQRIDIAPKLIDLLLDCLRSGLRGNRARAWTAEESNDSE